ncbi:hypothetical protein GZH46_00380 [Fragariocoptes setiger]|uniref:Uncharacterized protein n=1 Tax=Fragariocoptes setiger TaxID=1670756 RepID=A0ABQ7SCF6_9ACAR|nr:hypothetical protein GZH46_00380 [Fragariocoptes setiger]
MAVSRVLRTMTNASKSSNTMETFPGTNSKVAVQQHQIQNYLSMCTIPSRS